MPEKIWATTRHMQWTGKQSRSEVKAFNDAEQYHNTAQLIEWLEGEKMPIHIHSPNQTLASVEGHNAAIDSMIEYLRGDDE